MVCDVLRLYPLCCSAASEHVWVHPMRHTRRAHLLKINVEMRRWCSLFHIWSHIISIILYLYHRSLRQLYNRHTLVHHLKYVRVYIKCVVNFYTLTLFTYALGTLFVTLLGYKNYTILHLTTNKVNILFSVYMYIYRRTIAIIASD